MKKFSLIISLALLMCFTVAAQQESFDVRAGNKLYKSEKYTDAEVAYRKGLLKNPKSFEANYNLGNALFKQGKYADALEQYKNAIALKPNEKPKLAASFHNAGNALLTDKKIEESIDAYKMALKVNPNDNETRYNLAYAQALLKKQQQDKNKNKDDKNKDQQKEDQQKQDQQQQPQQPKSQMSKENAQQILDALMQDEKNALDKAKKQQVRGKRSAEKDW
ncbi:MAG: tetratricopeptide repeat protein [Bacteroidales bacterium]|nr:tetratricopeptide repeat protein [Bacteroidales bacterium]